ncbi:hypothetical protein BV25DRAFT_1843354 [Artomyces pyxidatus]|uniref:Uncharacterized protein n=1 Tax=Artomyces pyxidatus TaxID=48021 RepID=A0ACB8SF53_9AGAM|nr:hypothetical protein BV25DRAFT_1843354 [Artomyces pyxidatus]
MESTGHPTPTLAVGITSEVPLSHLRSLRFSADTPIDIRDFLSILSTPLETTLHIRFKKLDGFVRLDGRWDDVCTPPEVTLHNIVHPILDFFELSSRPAVELKQGCESTYRSFGILSVSRKEGNTDPHNFCALIGNHERSGSRESIPLPDFEFPPHHTDYMEWFGMEYSPLWDTRFFLGLPFEALGHSRLILPAMCRVFPLRDVDTLFVNSPAFSDPELWWLAFGRMEHVTTVVVSGDAVRGFAAALRCKGRPCNLPSYAALNTSDREVSFEERWGTMTGRPLPAFLDDLELPSRLFPNLTNLQIDSLTAGNPVLGVPNVLED